MNFLKKIVLVTLGTLLFSLSLNAQFNPEPLVKPGDCNGDQMVNVSDVNEMVHFYNYGTRYDINGDKLITKKDILLLLQYVLAIESGNTGDTPFIMPGTGDIDNNGKIDTDDILKLEKFITFRNAYDVNGSCQFTITDIVYLLNYIFSNGLKPVIGCLP